MLLKSVLTVIKTVVRRTAVSILLYLLILGSCLSAYERPRLGLVLSGGGARGIAHIGVLKALEEIGVIPDIIVGTSMGAIVGGLYASGKSVDQLIEEVRSLNPEKIFAPYPFRTRQSATEKIQEFPVLFKLNIDARGNVVVPSSLISNASILEKLLEMTVEADYASNLNFDSLAVPFRAITTDLRTGELVVLDRGPLSRAIVASSAYPFVLEPVKIGKMILVDGGVINNVPVNIARQLGAEQVIAVDIVNRVKPLKGRADVFDILNQTINLLAYDSDTKYLNQADVIIRPELGEISSFDFDKGDTLVMLGYQATMRLKGKLEKYVGGKRKEGFANSAETSLSHARIEGIELKGLKRTRRFIVERELLIKEGANWSKEDLINTLRNLYSTGIFKTIYVTVSRKGFHWVKIRFNFTEKVTSRIALGAYFDNELETRGAFVLEHRNIFGVGLNSLLASIFSDQEVKLIWRSNTSRFFKTPFTGQYQIEYNRYKYPLYIDDEEFRGRFSNLRFNVSGGIQVKRVGLTTVGFRWSRNWVERNRVLGLEPRRYEYSSVVFRVFVDDRDRPDIPSKGRLNLLEYEQSLRGKELEGVSAIHRVSLSSDVYSALTEKFVLSFHFRAGLLTNPLSYYEKFPLGGLKVLPGYHCYEVWVNNFCSLGLDVRQRYRQGIYVISRFRLTGWWSETDEFSRTTFRKGLALGVIVDTPIGPIDMEYGTSLFQEKNARNEFYISIGKEF